MKTTLELPDALLLEAKALAAKREMTLTDLVSMGLRKVVEDLSVPVERFKMPDASVNLGGLVDGYDWNRIRDLIYDRDDTYDQEPR